MSRKAWIANYQVETHPSKANHAPMNSSPFSSDPAINQTWKLLQQTANLADTISTLKPIGQPEVASAVAEMNATLEAIRALGTLPRNSIAESLRLAAQSSIADLKIGGAFSSLLASNGGMRFPSYFEEGVGLLRTWDFTLGGVVADYHEAIRKNWSPKFADTIFDLTSRASQQATFVSRFQSLGLSKAELESIDRISELALMRAFAQDENDSEFSDFLSETASIIAEEERAEVIYETALPFDRRVLSSGVDTALFNAIRRDPTKVFKMTPRNFEEFIAEIFARNGYDVNLTPQTRDGGYDILAVSNNALTGKEIHLVECKRYAAARKVSVGVVRSLHGVVAHEGATKGIIVTTSGFSKVARDFEQCHHGKIKLHDYQALLSWIQGMKS